MEDRTYTVHIMPAAEGGYWAYVPALPGCFTQGRTLEEIVGMAREAVEGFIELLAEQGKAVPSERRHPAGSTLNIQVRTPARA